MPKNIKIIGEISADGDKIVLIADGPDEDTAYAAKLLQLMTPLFSNSNPPGALVCPLTWAAVVQLSTTFAGSWVAGPKLQQWIMVNMQARTEWGHKLKYYPPGALGLRSYQREGALQIASVGRCVFFDEPGTGKTVTTIAGLRERFLNGHIVTPIIVVAPNSVVDSWVRHVKEWTPEWSVIAWRGSPDFRARLAKSGHDVYVVSYETARNDAKNANPKQSPLIAVQANTVVCDEQHLIKNHTTARSKAVVRLAERAQNFVGLSGTPITHSPKNLWPALKAMSPGAWPSSERWLDRYCLTVPGDYGADKVLGMNQYTEPEFWNCILGQHRRVAKADVLTELPPKVYSIRTVELPPAYRKAYDQMAADMLAELPDGQELSVMGVLAQLTRLSQLACAAADIEVTTELKPDEFGNQIEHVHQKVHLKNPSWKIDALMDVLEERCGPNGGEQVVVFAPSRQLIKLAGARCEKEGYKVGYIMGGQTARERTANVDAFQAGELDVVVVVTQAGGVGITLTKARTAVFLARPWSLVDALQAEDRLHRIGAEHESIEIIDIVASNTIDTRVRSVLKERAGALSDLVKDPRIVAELLGGASVTRLKAKAS